MRIGIVGAGMAGLACAEGLAGLGHEVVLFDKGRGPGGRMSTRRLPTSAGEAHFDYGAQYFTVRDKNFLGKRGDHARRNCHRRRNTPHCIFVRGCFIDSESSVN